jgi:hypothetical protein
MLSLVFASWALAIYMFRADPTETVAVSSAEKDKRVRVSSDKEVKSVSTEDDKVATVAPDKLDRTAVLITGLKEGRTRVNVAVDGKNVGFDVTVDQGAPGLLGERREEIRRLQDLNTVAEARWLAALIDLKVLEKQRPEDQEWYQQQLRALETGTDPVKAVVYNKGEPLIDPKSGRPELKEVDPKLRTRSEYRREIEKTQSDVQEARANILALIAKQQDLTDTLKTIRNDLALEEKKLESIREEREYLDPLLYNHVGESQVVVDRQQRLLARLIELSLGLTLDGNTTKVAEVKPKSPAARAGIQAGDELTAVVGGKTATPRDVVKAVLTHNPGDRIPVEIRRGGKAVKLDVELGGATRLQ